MSQIIVSLLVFAGTLFIFISARRRERNKIISKLILIYLENASPMTPYDLMECLAESGCPTRDGTFAKIMDQLVTDNEIQYYVKKDGDRVRPYTKYYSLVKSHPIPTPQENQKS